MKQTSKCARNVDTPANVVSSRKFFDNGLTGWFEKVSHFRHVNASY